MAEGFIDYRHPVQGWSIPLPVTDVDNPPEVVFVKGMRMERHDVAPAPRQDALALVVGRALARPLLWDGMRSDERETWMARGRIAVEALQAAGALE